MRYYDQITRDKIRSFRSQGYTYTEIQQKLSMKIPKGTLNYICRGIVLTPTQRQRIFEMMQPVLAESRRKAVVANRKILEAKIEGYRKTNAELNEFMQDPRAKLVALAILYLGEGSKWQGSRSPKVASSDPMIIRLYIDLLRECYGIPRTKLHARVQHRADQKSEDLVKYWSKITGIKKFYPCYIDKRTIGKPTKKTNYKGVCSVGSAGTHIQLELAEIADIISGAVRGIGAAG